MALATGWPARAENVQHPRVQSRVFALEYAVNDQALPLDSVQLWYTQDGGRTWQLYGFDDDRQSPFTFHAPGEGLFGFFLVLTNATGASGQPPTSGSQAHQWAFVDYTPPVVQLHVLRRTTVLAQRVVQIRWTAIDTNLVARPVEISYQRPPAEQWIPVTPDPVANTGRYDWRLPDDLVGSVTLRVTVRDKGDHRVHSNEQEIEVAPLSRIDQTQASRPVVPGGSTTMSGSPTTGPGSPKAGVQAARLHADALAHRDRGNYRGAIARLREAARLDPQMTDAFADMAGMLYLLGDFDRALGAYEIALTQQPTMRKALQGVARVYRQKQDYSSAAQRLRTILRYNPNDAEIWMNLGDIAVYQGDEIVARDCYTRATEIEPSKLEVVDAARKRLALMQEVSRSYRLGGR
ncbi:MAG: tetratricopeptide repeat protein [Planctomycetota bacterium]|jgi:Flp pilus assembly protein TadD